MTGAELSKIENAVALLQQGRTTEARDELAEILKAHGAAVPALPQWVARRDAEAVAR
jgi:hypothetical protein